MLTENELIKFRRELHSYPETGWCEFVTTHKIVEKLRSIKVSFSKLDTAESIRKWNNKEIPVGLIHPASAGHGLNLQSGGSCIVWFGLTWSLELYQQTNARLWRQGQKETVVIHHLVAKNTIDEDVMSALEKKETGQAALLRAVKAKVGGSVDELR